MERCRLVGYGWPGFKSMNLWRQDKVQCACAAAFVEALRNGEPAPNLLEVSRVTIEVAQSESCASGPVIHPCRG